MVFLSAESAESVEEIACICLHVSITWLLIGPCLRSNFKLGCRCDGTTPRRSKRAYAPSDLEGSYDPRFLAFEFTRLGGPVSVSTVTGPVVFVFGKKMVPLGVYQWMLRKEFTEPHQASPSLSTPAGTSCCGTIRQGDLVISRGSMDHGSLEKRRNICRHALIIRMYI